MNWILLLATVALATNPRESDDPCDAEPALLIERVKAAGEEEAYLCLIQNRRLRDALVEAILATPQDDPGRPRLTRALALHLVTVADEPWEPELVRLLNAADRRLAADGVKARRGRQSPSPEHDAVFQKQGWYEPKAGYTDNMLTLIERKNIELADKPPRPTPPPPPEEPAVQTLPPLPATPATGASTCGCATGGAAGLGLLALLPLLGLRRRR